jgi:hypothetical protein
MTSLMQDDQDVTVPTSALEQAREVLRQVALGDPVDTPAAAAEAARALAALPPRESLR